MEYVRAMCFLLYKRVWSLGQFDLYPSAVSRGHVTLAPPIYVVFSPPLNLHLMLRMLYVISDVLSREMKIKLSCRLQEIVLLFQSISREILKEFSSSHSFLLKLNLTLIFFVIYLSQIIIEACKNLLNYLVYTFLFLAHYFLNRKVVVNNLLSLTFSLKQRRDFKWPMNLLLNFNVQEKRSY